MKELINNNKTLIFIGIIIVSAFSRIIVHPWNLTPVGAMAIFSGAYLSRGFLKYLIPLGAYWLSDLVVMNTLYAHYFEGFQWFGSVGVFVALFAIIGLSSLIFNKVERSKYLITSVPTAIIMSIVFFLVTNSGSWLSNPIYPKNITGLFSSLGAGVPFFQATLTSYVFYSVILFGLVYLMERNTQNSQLAA